MTHPNGQLDSTARSADRAFAFMVLNVPLFSKETFVFEVTGIVTYNDVLYSFQKLTYCSSLGHTPCLSFNIRASYLLLGLSFV